jgi:hypothetical protein
MANMSTRAMINRIQSNLNFEGFRSYQFNGNKGLGKVGVGGFILGVLFGISIAGTAFCSLFAFILDNPPNILYSMAS